MVLSLSGSNETLYYHQQRFTRNKLWWKHVDMPTLLIPQLGTNWNIPVDPSRPGHHHTSLLFSPATRYLVSTCACAVACAAEATGAETTNPPITSSLGYPRRKTPFDIVPYTHIKYQYHIVYVQLSNSKQLPASFIIPHVQGFHIYCSWGYRRGRK